MSNWRLVQTSRLRHLLYVLAPITILGAIAAYFAWHLPNAISPVDKGHRPLTNAVLFYIEK